MEEPETLARGSPESAAWFRAALEEIGATHGSLARLMKRCGDDRKPATILRNLRRMASGDARVSGEMRVVLHFLRHSKVRQARMAARKAEADMVGREGPELGEQIMDGMAPGRSQARPSPGL